jgi:hypothetical protein
MPKHKALYYFVTITYGNVTAIYRSRQKVLGHPAQRTVMANAVQDFTLRYPALVAQSTREGTASDDAGTQGVDYNMLV